MKVDVQKVWVDDKFVHILTADGIERRERIDNYESLRNATKEQLQDYEVDNIGIHWEQLDEDLSFEGFFMTDNWDDKTELYRIFKSVPEINVAGVARRLGIQQSLMAAYIAGTKSPSKERYNQIINELHSIGKVLLEVV